MTLRAYAWKTIGVLSRNQKIRGERVDFVGGGGEKEEPQRENAQLSSLDYVNL